MGWLGVLEGVKDPVAALSSGDFSEGRDAIVGAVLRYNERSDDKKVPYDIVRGMKRSMNPNGLNWWLAALYDWGDYNRVVIS